MLRLGWGGLTGGASDLDWGERGLAYLYQMRRLALDPDLIELVYDLERRAKVCQWIGQQIASVNAELSQCLLACQACFHPWQRPSIQIFAAPFSSRYGVDGLCNLTTMPLTILVDVGRVVPADWIALVAHEYAHAYLGVPGHHAEFGQVLAHLARGLGLSVPPLSAPESAWRTAPPYQRTANSLDFWLGRG